MVGIRKIAGALIAIAVLVAGIAATTPHNWGQGLGAAAAASATVAATESGACVLNNTCP